MTTASRVAMILVGAAAACGGGAPPAPTPIGSSEPGPVTACPGDLELTALARAAWGVEEPPPVELEVACLPGRFGEPGYVLTGSVRHLDDDDLTDRHTAVVNLAGEAIAHAVVEGLTWRDLDYNAERPEYRVVDLDGDGVDELLTWLSLSPRGVFQTTLAVTAIQGDDLVVGELRVLVSYDDTAFDPDPPGPTSCDAEVEILGAGAQAVVELTATEPTGDPDVIAESCLTPGRHRFVYRDGELVPAP
ncbi:MAG: hypothetical protein R2939_17640 [Kofleriaceae bacterium]